MTQCHAVVWMDHREARILQFNREEVERLVLHAERPTRHLHRKAGAVGPGKAAEDHAFHRAVESALAAASEILVVGPGGAKQEFIRHVERSDPGLRARVVGVETVIIRPILNSWLSRVVTSAGRTACSRSSAERAARRVFGFIPARGSGPRRRQQGGMSWRTKAI